MNQIIQAILVEPLKHYENHIFKKPLSHEEN